MNICFRAGFASLNVSVTLTGRQITILRKRGSARKVCPIAIGPNVSSCPLTYELQADRAGHAEVATRPVGRRRPELSGTYLFRMLDQSESALSAEECGTIEGAFVERTVRINALFDLDRVLTAAANEHNLAAQIVHFGWPHRAD